MTTPTPRTNAAIDKWVSRGDMRIVLDHARQLERELAAAQKRNTQLVKALDDMYGTPCEQIRHQQELQSAQEARQRAEADAESNRKDAERYRWLRGNGAIISRAAGIPVHLAHFGIGLDAAIDAAKGKP